MILLPIGSEIPLRRFPFVTFVLVYINVGIFLLQIMWPETRLQYAFISSRMAEGINLANALNIFSSMFMHASWSHLLSNMLMLWVFGRSVEDALDRLEFLLFYLASGIVATLVSTLAFPFDPRYSLGASGAIAAVMGAYLALLPKVRIRMFLWLVIFFARFRVPAWLVLIYFTGMDLIDVVLNYFFIRYDNVDHWAHIGGFFCGLLAARWLAPDREHYLEHLYDRDA